MGKMDFTKREILKYIGDFSQKSGTNQMLKNIRICRYFSNKCDTSIRVSLSY